MLLDKAGAADAVVSGARTAAMRGDDNNIVRTYGHMGGKSGDRDHVVRFDSRVETVGDLRSGVLTVGDLRSGVPGSTGSGIARDSKSTDSESMGSRVARNSGIGESGAVGKIVGIGIESTHEFPKLHSISHGSSIGVQFIHRGGTREWRERRKAHEKHTRKPVKLELGVSYHVGLHLP